ncbi:LutB/LldF family L-lactate oxidation iron-sulfur protein [Acidipropionibacterium timonense]|uniref:LutB/LldF family L-lactate oxidation iron-sulfur protein n=1 Tax=Acidipropionibacterium timonense TaxID=2161818 RepID=UPI0010322AB7|nr:LutB/LldF family L-lactate oxidation iron-sulfur protein [Acidipropionibacterium timonense]
MGTELRLVTEGNHGVARLTPAPDHPGTFLGMPKFSKAARTELEIGVQRKNMRNATTTIRNKRALRVSESPDWEDLRVAAKSIKDRVGRHLDHYLLEAEKNLEANGVHVHWARNAEEANRIVAQVAKDKGVDEVVKIKSITTQETDLNEYLEEQGIAAWETDLAELIVQLGHDRPSHIVVPAIHRNRSQVREIFLREMKNYGRPAPEDISDNPPELTNAARLHLREKFLRAEMGVSGGNFVVAETGSLVIVESEGNGRMCLTLPDTLVSIVGIEKVLPTFDDLEVFLKLLPRSATGERMNPYNSVWSGVTEGDGPQEQHVIFMDNGRTDVLADELGREVLRCIRCASCLNICPVYERTGGHAYGSVYPGPIGAALNPQLRGVDDPVDRGLPYACSLCGACNDVCPVKIPFTDILVHLRNRVVVAEKADKVPQDHEVAAEMALMKTAAWVMGDAKHFETVQKGSQLAGKVMRGKSLGPIPVPVAERWLKYRDVEGIPAQSFRTWWKKNREDH